MTTEISAIVYFDDSSDPAAPGWAWRVEIGDQRESGAATDPDDGVRQVRAYAPEAPPNYRIGAWEYHNHGGGEAFRWYGERVTRDDIVALEAEAGAAGDIVQAWLCQVALYGRDGATTEALDGLIGTEWGEVSQADARAECERVIRAAAA